MAKRKDSPIVLGVSLALIAAVAAGVLAYAFKLTKEPIAQNKAKKVNSALEEILPVFDNDPLSEAIEYNGVIFYPAKKSDELVGIAAKATTGKGFGGKLTIMLSMSPEGKLQTVIVTDQNETPGLGTVVTNRTREKTVFDLVSREKVEESGLPPNPVLDSFSGLSAVAAPWKVKKDGGGIVSITGATVSSRAVTDAVNLAAAAFKDGRNQLFAKFADEGTGK